jgi:small GTP-binding protein
MTHIKAFKIVIIGDSGVGKTSIIQWLITGIKSPYDTESTIGAMFSVKKMTINDKNIKFHIWDTAGQERYRSIAKMYFRETVCCIAVCDLTKKSTFNNLKSWIEEYHETTGILGNVMIIGNKSDFPKSQWEITEEELKEFAESNSYEYAITNCITGENINDTFTKIAIDIIKQSEETSKIDQFQMTPTVRPGIVDLVATVPTYLPKCRCYQNA